MTIDRATPRWLPPDLRVWVPADHLAHFILDAVEALALRQVKVNTRGPGHEPYPPTRRLGLLVYRDATGPFGSRRIEPSTSDHVAGRRLTADTHPDHATIGPFRRENQARLSESFVKVLPLAQEWQLAQFGQITVSLDGTKIAAHASKHAAVSYGRAGQRLAPLEGEGRQLLAQAEQADATLLQDGLTIPAGIGRRQARKAALEKARAGIETRAQARSATELAEPEKKRAARLARQQTVEPVFGLIKSAMGFRPFQLRGAGKASTGWTLVCLASNLRRRHTLGAGTKLAAAR